MPIRFVCPSCQQPLEIDDQWAGQSVACPYCQRVVGAPAQSTWEAGPQIPVATPARVTPETPPPPHGMRGPAAATSSTTAVWAVAMSACSAGFALVGMFTWLMAIGQAMGDRLGSQPTRDEIMQLQQEMIQNATVPTPSATTAAMIIGLLCGVLGLVLSIRTIMLGHRRGVGIFACVLALLCITCQGLLSLSLLSVSLLRQQQG